MSIIAKNKGGNFIPAPEGLWPGVCVDVVDLGIVESAQYKPRHMVQIRWVLDAEPKLDSGEPHMAVRSFGLSLNEKSNLRPFLEAWRGKKFTDDELDGFDLENLIGAPGQVQIVHNRKDGKTYGNVQTVVPYPRGMARVPVPPNYVRAKDRPDYKPPVLPDDEPSYPDEITSDDIPF